MNNQPVEVEGVNDTVNTRKACGEYDVKSPTIDNIKCIQTVYREQVEALPLDSSSSESDIESQKAIHPNEREWKTRERLEIRSEESFAREAGRESDQDTSVNMEVYVWPSDSDITVLRIKRKSRLLRKGGIQNWEGIRENLAIPGDGMHLAESPSMVNLATLVSSNSVTTKKEQGDDEYLVALSSWDPNSPSTKLSDSNCAEISSSKSIAMTPSNFELSSQSSQVDSISVNSSESDTNYPHYQTTAEQTADVCIPNTLVTDHIVNKHDIDSSSLKKPTSDIDVIILDQKQSNESVDLWNMFWMSCKWCCPCSNCYKKHRNNDVHTVHK